MEIKCKHYFQCVTHPFSTICHDNGHIAKEDVNDCDTTRRGPYNTELSKLIIILVLLTNFIYVTKNVIKERYLIFFQIIVHKSIFL